MERTCAAVRLGATASISETTPDAMGAEKLVPSKMAVESPVGTVLPLFQSE